MKSSIIRACAIGAIAFAGFAQMPSADAAMIHEYTRGAGTFGPGYANPTYGYDSLSATYDTDTEVVTWEVDFDTRVADAAWWVVSAGANPKGVTDELGIAYMDRRSGNAWIYAYNGANNNSSYQVGPLLQYLPGAYTTSGSVGTLSFDATQVNAQLDSGFAFGPSIGIWYHPVFNGRIRGNSNGINNFRVGNVNHASSERWFDVNNDINCSGANGCITTTTDVSAPATAGLLGIGLIALLGRRFRRAARA